MLGVIPWFKDIHIAQEDSVYLDEREKAENNGDLKIAVIRLPHTANFDEFDPLELEGLDISYITQRFEMANPHLIIVPGTKNTTADMQYLQISGIGKAIIEKAKSGTPVFGICGGYQILGKKILDPLKIEGDRPEVEGLGLLDIVTEFHAEKITRQVKGQGITDAGLLAGIKGQEVTGYEIHHGHTTTNEPSAAFHITSTAQDPADYADGTINPGGNVIGTYLHGIFYNDDFRHTFLNNVRRYWGIAESDTVNRIAKDSEYDKLAEIVRQNLDIKKVYEIIEKGMRK